MKENKLTQSFLMLFLHDTLKYVHFKKDPVQLPLVMSSFGFKSFLIVPKKERIQIKNIKVYEIGKAFSEAFSSRSLIKKTILEILTSFFGFGCYRISKC
jgi:hypothetical protein